MDQFDLKKERLVELLREKSLRLGRFTLTSGLTSSYYFDSKPTTLDPEGAHLSAWLILESLRREGIKAAAVGGMTLGADPIVSAVAVVSHIDPSFDPLPAFIVRKDAKQHGTLRFIEGVKPAPGSSVAIVDDVCTTGGSTLKAIEKAEEAQLRVIAVYALVDREQGGAARLSRYPFYPLVTASELLDSPQIRDQLLRLTSDAQS